MTNEESRTKIVEILEETEYEWTEEKNGYILQIFYDKLADALIAAGIGDVSELKKHRVVVEKSLIPEDDNAYVLPNIPPTVKQLYSGEEVEQIVKEREEYKHRAEVTEKMFDILHEESSMYMKVFSKEWYKQQAEKELAEEGKDEER